MKCATTCINATCPKHMVWDGRTEFDENRMDEKCKFTAEEIKEELIDD